MRSSAYTHPRMTRGYRRRIAVIGTCLYQPVQASPSSRARLGPVRPRGHVYTKECI